MARRRYTDEQLLRAWKATGTLAGTGRLVGLSVGGRSTRQLADRLTGLGVDVSGGSRPRVLYDPDVLEQAASASHSVAEVVRRIGARSTGGTEAHIGRRLKSLGIDTSHFSGQAHMLGRVSPRRRTAEELLTMWPVGSARPRGHLLRRALLDSGRSYVCSGCGLTDAWNGAPLRLHVDHINGDWLDNRSTNLRFLCPNCHSQTATFGRQTPPAVEP